MPKLSAGILLFRISKSGVVEVLIIHPGGPFWAKKDDGAWSIPKGEYSKGDDAYGACIVNFKRSWAATFRAAQGSTSES